MSQVFVYEEKCLGAYGTRSFAVSQNNIHYEFEFLQEVSLLEVTTSPSVPRVNSTSMTHVQATPDGDYVFIAF